MTCTDCIVLSLLVDGVARSSQPLSPRHDGNELVYGAYEAGFMTCNTSTTPLVCTLTLDAFEPSLLSIAPFPIDTCTFDESVRTMCTNVTVEDEGDRTWGVLQIEPCNASLVA